MRINIIDPLEHSKAQEFPVALRYLPMVLLLFTIGCGTASKSRQMETLMDAWHAEGQFNGTVLVAKGEDVLFAKGYGMANAEWQQPNDVDTVFRLASVSKQFTAAAILQLVEQGRVDLDGTISDYLPWYRGDTGSRITVHHLLSHQSGIPNYTAFEAFYSSGPSRRSYRTREFVEEWCSRDLEFEPGSRYSYCNSGYYILGAIVEEVTGKSLDEALTEQIFVPAGMRNSGIDDHRTIVPRRADGYRIAPNRGLTNVAYQDMSIYQGAGAMISTARDLHRWHLALLNNTVLSPEMTEKMFTPNRNGYGYGVSVGTDESSTTDTLVRRITHSGYYDGFNNYLAHYPDTGHVIVLLNNTGQTELVQMRDALAAILFDRPYAMPIGTHSIASAATDPVLSISGISSQGTIRGDDARFNNGTAEAGTTIYQMNLLIHDGENTYYAGMASGEARISDGKIHRAPGLVENRGMEFTATPGLGADLRIQVAESNNDSGLLSMRWQLRNDAKVERRLRFIWFIDADLYTGGSNAARDRVALVDAPEGPWRAIAITNDRDGEVAPLSEGLLMSTSLAPAALYGIAYKDGAAKYWTSSNVFDKTGPRAAGFRIPESIANTVQEDADGDLLSDAANDVAGSIQVDVVLPPGGTETLTLSVCWNPDAEIR